MSPRGIRITNPIESAQFDVYTDTSELREMGTPADFAFPVESVITVETSTVHLPRRLNVLVRDPEGDVVATSSNDETNSLPDGEYQIEVSPSHLKLYLRVESSVSAHREDTQTIISFPEPTRVDVGARSYHRSPAATITIPETIEGVMQGVSLLGSSLKTRSPERSFPTLRGHPPLLEFGDTLEVPAAIAAPDTSVTLELPATCEYVYPASSLAYYLGADLTPADTPALVVDGQTHQLPTGDVFQPAITRLFKRVFFMDCVVRTEGLYPVELHERQAFESAFGDTLDFASLYTASEAERLNTYLEISFDVIEPVLPTWKVNTDIVPTVGHATVLPYVVNDLSVIRCPSPPDPQPVGAPDSLTTFYRYGEASCAESDPRTSVWYILTLSSRWGTRGLVRGSRLGRVKSRRIVSVDDSKTSLVTRPASVSVSSVTTLR